MATGHISIATFIADAKQVLANGEPLAEQQTTIGARLVELAKRDDLTQLALPVGPTDASTGAYLLWREPPHLLLMIAEWAPGYRSPIHEHKDFWVVGAGYRGRDRWDMQNPTVMILDEPFAGSDAAGAEGICEAIRLVSRLAPGVILVDHNVDLVAATVDRMMLLDQGRMRFLGNPRECVRSAELQQVYFGRRNTSHGG